MQRRVSKLRLLCCMSAALCVSSMSAALAQEYAQTSSLASNGAIDGCYDDDMSGGLFRSNGGVGAVLGGRRGMTSCRGPEYGQADLFRNYWVGPNCDSAVAQLYIAPRPTPEYVGHTFYTYEPFMPHEFLYAHNRTYHRYYNEGRGLTRARARWHTPAPMAAAEAARSFFNFPR